jgi:hypothetical protein
MVPTPSSTALQLALLYALPVFLLLVLCLATRWRVWVKVLMIVIAGACAVVSQSVLVGAAGWPTEDRLPEKFLFLSAVFDEPNPSTGSAGALYVWAHPIEDGKTVAHPRAYKLAYQKDLKGILADGLKKARDGNAQLGSTEPTRGPRGLGWLRPANNDEVKLKLTDVPRAQLPEK